MSSEELNPEVGSEAGASSQMVARTGPSYVEAAPVMDVMFEQLEYLLSHRSTGCPQGCADCARLAQVESCLLLPFGSVRPKPSLN
jgi:hypothetical protein